MSLLAGLVVEDLEESAPRKKKKRSKGAKGGGSKEGEVSEEVALQVDLTKAKLAAMEFEEKEAAKKREKQERKARKAKEKAKRQGTTRAKVKRKEDVYEVKNLCDGCGEPMLHFTPFQLEGKLYCSPECLKATSQMQAMDASVARRSGVSKVEFGRDTDEVLGRHGADKKKKAHDAREAAYHEGEEEDDEDDLQQSGWPPMRAEKGKDHFKKKKKKKGR